MRLLIFSASIILLSYTVNAQNNEINNTTQTWSEIDLSGKITKRLKWQMDFQYSRQSPYEQYDLIRFNSQLTLRPWLHYYVKPNIRISAFYGLWDNFAIDEVGARAYPEYRGAIQVNFYNLNHRNIITKRTRIEFRDIRDRDKKYELVLRERTMLKYQHLLLHDTYDKHALYFVGFDEFFINSGSAVTGYHIFDQNRIFLGAGYNITNDITFETGYFNQFQQHPHDNHFDMNHVLQLTLMVDNI